MPTSRLESGRGGHPALPLVLAGGLDADWCKARARLGGNDAA